MSVTKLQFYSLNAKAIRRKDCYNVLSSREEWLFLDLRQRKLRFEFHLDLEFVQLLVVDLRGCVEHHVAAGVVLREGDVVADRLRTAEERAEPVETEGQTAVDDWKKVLTAGSTKTPEALAKMAGVDISTDAPLLDTIETIGSIIDEICELTEELGC